ncbi:MAG: helix-turn-helix domain-containing protein [Nanoarchaeota archaeon]
MNQDTESHIKYLEKIGLTSSESKVYIALLELGESSTGPIINQAGVASSKIYELLDKLMSKGLVTTFKESNTKYFKAVSPTHLKEYLRERQAALDQESIHLKAILPSLEQRFAEHRKETEVEIFRGYKGVQAMFKEMNDTLKAGDEFLVIGGGDAPTTNLRTKQFFEKIHRERSRKGIRLRIIFSEARRASLASLALFPHTAPRYLPYGTPSTINIYADVTILLTMSPVPAAIRIKDKNITASYRTYFNHMWRLAKR